MLNIAPLSPLRVTIPEAAEALRISRSKVYVRINEGALALKKDGRRSYIETAELQRYVSAQNSAA